MSARLNSPSTARNTEPILEVLRAHMPARARVLEVACGTGEHALAFSTALPGLAWTPTDPDPEALASANAWRETGPVNLQSPLRLDASDPETWPAGPYEAIFCANMIHISPWSATEGLMRLAGQALINPGGLLVTYGPYLEADRDTAPSNLAFDGSLKARDPAWGLPLRVEMPANNLTLLFRRV